MSQQKDSRKAAEKFLAAEGRWVSNKELSARIGMGLNNIGRCLAPLVESGVLQREFRGELLMWRMKPVVQERRFGCDWPPGFVSQFDTVVVASYETRVK